ncbi:hypothetical protein HY732_03000 [Candidatus Uhrbacteria bacterium]|nr:hypothetical protein [Candidatus Uhrbacteria bacterium]
MENGRVASVCATILFSFIGTSAVFAQSAAFPQTTASGSPPGSIASLVVLGGIALVALAIALLIVFFVNPKDFPRKELFGAVWPLTKKHLWLLIGVVICLQLFAQIPTLLTALAQAALQVPSDEPLSSGLNMIASFLLGVILQSGFIALALHIIDGAQPRFSDIFSQLPLFFRYLGATILYTIGVAIGLILLIVPGIYVMLTYGLWPYFLVDKKVSIMDSFRMSAQATRGHKGSLFLLYVMLAALNILGLFVFLVGILVTAPMAALMLAYAYRKLTGSSPATAPSAPASMPAGAV